MSTWQVRASPEVTIRAFTVDGRVVGSITSFVIEGDTEVTYTEISFAKGRKTEIEETILRLDEPLNTAPSDASSGLRPTH